MVSSNMDSGDTEGQRTVSAAVVRYIPEHIQDGEASRVARGAGAWLRPNVAEGPSCFSPAVLLDILVEAEKRGIKVALKPAVICVHIVVSVVPVRQSSPDACVFVCVCVVLV